MANQDGGVFKTTGPAKNAKKKKVNKHVTAPEGKFTTFHKTIQRDAFKQINDAFMRDFTQKRPNDMLLIAVPAPHYQSGPNQGGYHQPHHQ